MKSGYGLRTKFQLFKFSRCYFRVSVVGRENRKNLDLAKISRYTVYVFIMTKVRPKLTTFLCLSDSKKKKEKNCLMLGFGFRCVPFSQLIEDHIIMHFLVFVG